MRLTAALLLTACVVVACGRPSPVAHSHDSPEALARAVLTAIEKQDLHALNELALNEQEFREHAWPELPAARPERNLPFSYVWGDLHQKSNVMLRATLAKHGGKKYDLRSIRFSGETTEYPSYRVHRESELTVRNDEGKEEQVRLFGSVIEKDNRFKVFSYVVSD
ncbi:MAG TPA: hypothetical protein VJM31_13275 [Vicinamibacterales bacterium]|nr:hypothetical protein [Vicinamibacterales bacterium]